MFAAFDPPPALYVVIAIVITLWQAYRGYRFQTLTFKPHANSPVQKREAIFLLFLADGFFYAVCSAAGFVALWTAFELIDHVTSFSDIGAGFGVVWVLMIAVGITGPTGQLPWLIQKMKPPWGG